MKLILTIVLGGAVLTSIILWIYNLIRIILVENKTSKLRKMYGSGSKKKSKLLPMVVWGALNVLCGLLCALAF